MVLHFLYWEIFQLKKKGWMPTKHLNVVRLNRNVKQRKNGLNWFPLIFTQSGTLFFWVYFWIMPRCQVLECQVFLFENILPCSSGERLFWRLVVEEKACCCSFIFQDTPEALSARGGRDRHKGRRTLALHDRWTKRTSVRRVGKVLFDG